MASELSLILSLLMLLSCNNPFQPIHASDGKHEGFSLRLIHRDSPESPSYEPNLTNEERWNRLALISEARVLSLMDSIDNNSSRTLYPQTLRPRIHDLGQSSFVVQVGLGTFSSRPRYMKTYLEIDTTTSLIWTQCQGCNPCFPQTPPPFRRRESSTYAPLPCGQCSQTCQQDHCQIREYRPVHAGVEGIEAKETFLVETSNNELVSLPRITFTCALRTTSFKPGFNISNRISGVMGLSVGRTSFVRQIENQIFGRFSYCLQWPYTQTPTRMYLRFGNDIPPLQQYGRGYTPILDSPTVAFRLKAYYLNLEGISVGSTRLNIDPQIFGLRRDGTGGCIIDSASPFTFIPREAYTALEKEMDRQVYNANPGHGLMRVASPDSSYDFCYMRSPAAQYSPAFPPVKFHFANNADFVVHSQYYLNPLVIRNVKYFCLTILLRNPDIPFTLLGAHQQTDYRIIYDIRNKMLSFAPEKCATSN